MGKKLIIYFRSQLESSLDLHNTSSDSNISVDFRTPPISSKAQQYQRQNFIHHDNDELIGDIEFHPQEYPARRIEPDQDPEPYSVRSSSVFSDQENNHSNINFSPMNIPSGKDIYIKTSKGLVF